MTTLGSASPVSTKRSGNQKGYSSDEGESSEGEYPASTGRSTPAYMLATDASGHESPVEADNQDADDISDMSDREIYRHWHQHQAPNADLARMERKKQPFCLQLLRWDQGHLLWEAFELPESQNGAKTDFPYLHDPSISVVEIDLPAGTIFRRWRLNHEDELRWHKVDITPQEQWRGHHLDSIVQIYQPPRAQFQQMLAKSNSSLSVNKVTQTEASVGDLHPVE